MQSVIDVRAPTNGTATSAAAARAVQHRVASDCARILDLLRTKLWSGATCDEVEQLLGLSHQTCSARFRQLALNGRIFKSGDVRPTRTGCDAVVWRIA